MSFNAVNRKERRASRHRRVRRKVHGTAERPRMSIMISARHMYVQFIDDDRGATMAAASTLKGDGKHNVAAANGLGKRAGEVAIGGGIQRAVVDRGGFKFHGRVKAIVEGAKAAGIAFEAKEEK